MKMYGNGVMAAYHTMAAINGVSSVTSCVVSAFSNGVSKLSMANQPASKYGVAKRRWLKAENRNGGAENGVMSKLSANGVQPVKSG